MESDSTNINIEIGNKVKNNQQHTTDEQQQRVRAVDSQKYNMIDTLPTCQYNTGVAS